MSVSATIGGSSVIVIEGSYKFDDTVDLRGTLEFTVHDSTGTVVYQVGQPVALTDSVNGFTFSGFVNDAVASNITPNVDNLYDIKCGDNTTLAARQYSKKDYENQFAGDIAVDLLQNYLAADGVTGAYAIRRDTSQTDFSTGTLSGTVGANNVGDGDLELAPAGSDVTIVEDTTANFSTGSLTLVTSANNTLTASTVNAIKMTGTMNVPGISGAVATYKAWSGSYTVVSTDALQYYVWIDSSSPEIKGCVDVVCTDGTRLQDQDSGGTVGLTYADLNDLQPNPGADLSGYADGQWYLRAVSLTGFAGKTVAYVSVLLGGQKTGAYTAWFKTIRIYNQNTGVANLNAFTGTLNTSQQLQTVGYESVQISVVPTCNLQTYQSVGIPTSTALGIGSVSDAVHERISSAYSIGAAALLKNSIISWQVTEPANTKLVVRCALDNGTPVECINNAAIPNLVPGMNLASRTLTIYEDFYKIAGASPESAPTLSNLEILIKSAPACAKTDATYTTSFSGGEVGVSFSSTIANSSVLNLTGATRNWDLPIGISSYHSDQTAYMGVAFDSVFQRAYQFGNPSSGNESKDRFDFAGQHQNFTAEVDVEVVSDVSSGLVYRCTNLSANNGSYAYAAMLSVSAIVLKKGTNTTGGGSATTLTTVAITLTANSWHRIKVVVNGTTHKVYLDDVLQITKTDSSFSATGYVGTIGTSPTQAYPQINFDNFGVMDAISGTWTSPNIPLNSVTSYGNSYISWRDRSESPASNDTILVQYSIDSGSTYTACTNGQPLQGLTVGQSLTGVNLKLKVTLSSTTAQSMPGIDDLYLLVTGQFSSSGTRIAPALPLTNVGIVGSTLASWDGLQPTSTTLVVASSIDSGITWTNVGSGASGSGPIAGINVQPDPIDDTFDTNTSANYTQSALTTPATWIWDTANSRVTATGGNGALLLYAGLSYANGDTMADLDQADGSGIVARANGTTMYALVLYDSSGIAHQNAFYLYKIIAGTFTQLATGSITFTRGTPYRFHLITYGTTISATMDGTTLASVTDSGITSAGLAGLISGPLARVYQFRSQAYGQNVSALSALTRVTMTSTDPTVSPQLTDLTLSAYGPDIQPGALIPKANYSVYSGSTNTIAADLDDLTKQCSSGSTSFVWDIDKNLKFIFRKRTANPSPWIATGADILISTPPQVENIEDLFRNIQFVTGGTDILPFTKTFTGDGSTQTWTLDYPIDSLTSVTINAVSTYTIGIKGVDTGRNFYYEQGSQVISQDTSGLAPVATQKVTFGYNAQITIATEIRNDAAIATRAALDNTTGIIQEVEDGTSLSKIACLQKNLGLLNQYSVIGGRTFTFLTKRAGLASSQVLTMFAPQFSVHDAQFLITDVSVVWKTTMANNIEVAQPFYSVTATSGPIVGGYERWLSNIITGVGR